MAALKQHASTKKTQNVHTMSFQHRIKSNHIKLI